MGAVSINTNIAARSAARRLAQVDAEYSGALERLSSGMRINRASDDAAGLALASALETKGRLYGQADRNIRDSLSVLDVLESGLAQQSTILVRMAELAEQSADGSFSSAQREALQIEYSKLRDEFARIAATTSFNGQNLARADRNGLSSIVFQVGINGNDTARIAAGLSDSGEVSGTLGSTHILVDDLSSYDDFDAFASTQPTKEEIQAKYGFVQEIDLEDSDQELLLIFYRPSSGDQLGIRGFIQLEDEERYEKTLFEDSKSVSDGFGVDFDPATGKIAPGSAQLSLEVVGDSGVGGLMVLDYRALRITSGATSVIDFTGVENEARARVAVDVTRARLDEISSLRGNLGALSSRMQAGLAVTAASKENSQAALSRIRDADIAAESSRLLASRILSQSAAAVLAQANQQPALALTLLSDSG